MMRFSIVVLLASSLSAQDVSSPGNEEVERRERGRILHIGKSTEAARAVVSGLQWLAEHQDPDGHWTLVPARDDEGQPVEAKSRATVDIGLTALALLAFLGDGNTASSGPHQKTVARGLDWLIGQQNVKSGLIGTKSAHDYIYGHAIATLALADAWQMTRRGRKLEAAVQIAAENLLRHRNPYAAWRYMPRDGDNDASVTAWCLLALETCKRGGIELGKGYRGMPNQALEWLSQMTDPDSGRTGYSSRGGSSSRLRGDHATRFPREFGEVGTSIALYLRSRFGKRDDEDLRDMQIGLLLERSPVWDTKKGTVDEYYWFFASQALHQVGGDAWKQWYGTLSSVLVEKQQDEDSEDRGSWDPVGAWAETGGRVYSTAMHLLSLQAPYRVARR